MLTQSRWKIFFKYLFILVNLYVFHNVIYWKQSLKIINPFSAEFKIRLKFKVVTLHYRLIQILWISSNPFKMWIQLCGTGWPVISIQTLLTHSRHKRSEVFTPKREADSRDFGSEDLMSTKQQSLFLWWAHRGVCSHPSICIPRPSYLTASMITVENVEHSRQYLQTLHIILVFSGYYTPLSNWKSFRRTLTKLLLFLPA